MNIINKIKFIYTEIFITPRGHDLNKFYLSSEVGFDRFRAFIWSNIRLSQMSDIRDYFGKATIAGRIWRKIAFPPFMRPGYDFFNFYINQKHIDFIRKHRNEKRLCTDRYLSDVFKKEFPNVNINGGDQYDGRWIGEYAKDYTGDESLGN